MAVVGAVLAFTQMEELINKTNLDKIESFMNDPQYKEALESSANYNTRLCIERRMRLPFIDTQTGVAQNHSSLFMHPRHRIPGLLPGQIYTYPRPRWRKKRRQYLTLNSRTYGRGADMDEDMHSISQLENPALQDTDSKDSQLLKDEVAKDWYYDEQDMLEMEDYAEPDADSDLDYEETYKKGRRKKGAGRGRGTDSPNTPGRKKGGGRGRKKSNHSFEPTPGDPDKPFACELCGARYKTRPGLTYHYGHSHKEGTSDENSRDSNAPLQPPTATNQPNVPPMGVGLGGAVAPPNVIGGSTMSPYPGLPPMQLGGAPNVMPPSLLSGMGEPQSSSGVQQGQHGAPPTPGQVYQDSYVSFLNQAPGPQGRPPRGRPPPPHLVPPNMNPVGPVMGIPPNLPPNLPQSQPVASIAPPVVAQSPQLHQHQPPISMEEPPMPILQPEQPMEPHNLPTRSHQGIGEGMSSKENTGPPAGSGAGTGKSGPSPYCDFCLGDARENKKTGSPEELVSCSDCGRSGHPSCLQFTPNMMISVKKYRWQCIECKCCSVCGTSDNDDQLLFCDDCDRGYHMYCLTPPLENPPEGSWSCKLCIDLFHK